MIYKSSRLKTVGLIISFFTSFILGFYSNKLFYQQKVKRCDYLNINDPNTILMNKFDYYNHINDNESIPLDLKTYLIEDLPKDYYDLCHKKNNWTEKDFEYYSRSFDLNNDGTNEFIIMPFIVCGKTVRGASWNGNIIILNKNNNEWRIIGYFEGNGYTILKNKTNGYNDIMVHSHISAATGIETIYKFQTISNGQESSGNYEESFSKRYDLTRVEK